jgi:hypothetical protein
MVSFRFSSFLMIAVIVSTQCYHSPTSFCQIKVLPPPNSAKLETKKHYEIKICFQVIYILISHSFILLNVVSICPRQFNNITNTYTKLNNLNLYKCLVSFLDFNYSSGKSYNQATKLFIIQTFKINAKMLFCPYSFYR